MTGMKIDLEYLSSLAIVPTEESDEKSRAGIFRDSTRLVCFRLGTEEYGIPISQAREVIEVIPITPTPHAPEFIMGVINLRSGIITVMDLGLLTGMPPYARRMEELKKANKLDSGFSSDNPAIVIIHIEDRIFGIIVDTITAMINLDDKKIMHPPFRLDGFIQSLVSELVQLDNRLIMKLDLDELIEHEALKALEEGTF